MCDGPGLPQFMAAVGEMARGANAPSVPPVCERHVLNATDPPRVTCRHRAYEEVAGSKSSILTHDHLVHRSFFFSPSDITALRRLVPPHLGHCSTFEILTACLWICRTIALQPDPNEEMRVIWAVNVREKFNPPLLPRGYYGNGFLILAAVATAGELSKKPIGYALELVRKAKADMTEEFMRSTASLMADFGWGNAIYAGTATAIAELGSFCIQFTNKKGEDGIVVPFCMPSVAVERFYKELEGMLKGQLVSGGANSKLIVSSL
ncbi:hypothetical protein Peur_065364 [Populus x canadensis]